MYTCVCIHFSTTSITALWTTLRRREKKTFSEQPKNTLFKVRFVPLKNTNGYNRNDGLKKKEIASKVMVEEGQNDRTRRVN